jgi:hypothetical protein
VPTVVIAAATIRGSGRVLSGFNWADNSALLPVIPGGGGHLGFHSASSARPWCDLAVEKFLEQVVSMEA